jgi:hypothetical protein
MIVDLFYSGSDQSSISFSNKNRPDSIPPSVEMETGLFRPPGRIARVDIPGLQAVYKRCLALLGRSVRPRLG